MSSAGIAWLVWLAAAVCGALLGTLCVAVWVAIYVDYEAPDIALAMIPLAALAGALIGFTTSLTTWLICSTHR